MSPSIGQTEKFIISLASHVGMKKVSEIITSLCRAIIFSDVDSESLQHQKSMQWFWTSLNRITSWVEKWKIKMTTAQQECKDPKYN